MKEYKVIKYSSLYYGEWNNFVLKAKNSTFLFHRDFMEYHSDRFEDFSLLVYCNHKLAAILPANIENFKIHSHQGLSYGGLILPHKVSFQTVIECIYELLRFLSVNKISNLIFKQLPKIYHLRPSDELDYLLFILKAKMYRKDVSMTIPLNNKIQFSTLRKRKLKVALQKGLSVKLEENLTSFWNDVLIPNLKNTHAVSPVHTLPEISSLREKFPNNIKQYNVYLENNLLAGCTVFETDNVAHLQYISANKENNSGALDYLVHQLISNIYKDKIYFDFGICNENQGQNINAGLLNWKQSFGASPIVHDFYEINVDNYSLLKEVMI